MKLAVTSLLSLSALVAALPYAWATPAQQLAFKLPSRDDLAGSVDRIAAQVEGAGAQYVDRVKALKEDAWGIVRGFVEQGGKRWETLAHPALPEYRIRVTQPKLCDPTVKQLSGYLDIGEDKHLFFWFFESRSKPKVDPLVLWLNGGPGCSSSTGLLFELGPCSQRENGTVPNAHSWTSKANVIFLDQPVGVGYSYTDGKGVNTSPAAAEDVFAFLSMFIARYTEYSTQDFHISGESYAGTYLPNIATVILRNTLALKEMDSLAPLPTLQFKSVLIGNGLTDPLVQFGQGVYDYSCLSPYALFDVDGPECANIKAKAPTCERLISSCYKFNSRFTCVPAALYCWSQLQSDFQKLGLNPYDIRKTCDRAEDKDGPLCYKEMGWVQTYLNQPEIKAELGVAESVDFQSCNMQVNQAFMAQGDGMHNSAALLPALLDAGIRVLIYAGREDYICNYRGNQLWAEQLDSVFSDEYRAAPEVPYVLLGGEDKVGTVRVAGGGEFTAGNFTFVTIENAGHMVPFDQPEVALDMFNRWLANTPLVLSKPKHPKHLD